MNLSRRRSSFDTDAVDAAVLAFAGSGNNVVELQRRNSDSSGNTKSVATRSIGQSLMSWSFGDASSFSSSRRSHRSRRAGSFSMMSMSVSSRGKHRANQDRIGARRRRHSASSTQPHSTAPIIKTPIPLCTKEEEEDLRRLSGRGSKLLGNMFLNGRRCSWLSGGSVNQTRTRRRSHLSRGSKLDDEDFGEDILALEGEGGGDHYADHYRDNIYEADHESDRETDIHQNKTTTSTSTLRIWMRKHRKLLYLRAAVAVTLVCGAAATASLCYIHTTKFDHRLFRQEYDAAATLLLDKFGNRVQDKLSAAKTLSILYTSRYGVRRRKEGSETFEEQALLSSPFPNVTLPDFHWQTYGQLLLSGGRAITFQPFVGASSASRSSDEERREFEEYARRNMHQLWPGGDMDKSAFQRIHDGDGSLLVNDGVYAPIWQVTPIQGNEGMILRNAKSLCNTSRNALDVLRIKRMPTLTGFLHEDIYNAEFTTDIREDIALSNLTKSPSRDSGSILFYPVFDDFQEERMSEDGILRRSAVVGSIGIHFRWDDLFLNSLPTSVSGMIIVLETNSGKNVSKSSSDFGDTSDESQAKEDAERNVFTYRITEGSSVPIGWGDHHDERYDKLVRTATAKLLTRTEEADARPETSWFFVADDNYQDDHLDPWVKTKDVDHALFGDEIDEESGIGGESGIVQYTVRIYPTSELEASYATSKPVVCTTVVALLFVAVALIFFLYDIIVRSRARRVTNDAVRSHRVVDSMFPKFIRALYLNSVTETTCATYGKPLEKYDEDEDHGGLDSESDGPIGGPSDDEDDECEVKNGGHKVAEQIKRDNVHGFDEAKRSPSAMGFNGGKKASARSVTSAGSGTSNAVQGGQNYYGGEDASLASSSTYRNWKRRWSGGSSVVSATSTAVKIRDFMKGNRIRTVPSMSDFSIGSIASAAANGRRPSLTGSVGKSEEKGCCKGDNSSVNSGRKSPTPPKSNPLRANSTSYMLQPYRAMASAFPSVTIFFAELCGFSTWCRESQPETVFKLLERVFFAFDELSNKYGVFKVQTVWDCYMAAAGLPDAQPDHAVRICKFALAVRSKYESLRSELEKQLGTSIKSLKIRIGCHSGEVTAGVLRGQRGAFNIFGDTVNTASRMESTCEDEKIQISSDTAQLVRGAGYGHWLTERKEKIQPKGKGEMQTFWVNYNNRRRAGSDGGEVVGRKRLDSDGCAAGATRRRVDSADGSAVGGRRRMDSEGALRGAPTAQLSSSLTDVTTEAVQPSSSQPTDTKTEGTKNEERRTRILAKARSIKSFVGSKNGLVAPPPISATTV